MTASWRRLWTANGITDERSYGPVVARVYPSGAGCVWEIRRAGSMELIHEGAAASANGAKQAATRAARRCGGFT